jgi:hypothetical protein
MSDFQTYLGSGHSPDLEVVGSHEKVGDTGAHHANNPLVKSLGLGAGDTSLKSGIDHAIDALDLLLFGKHGNVVLERVGDPLALAANVGDTLVAVPIILLGKSLIDAVVEILVVGEDDVTTDIVKLRIH